MSNNRGERNLLRSNAESELADSSMPLPAASARSAEELLHELQVHQVQLEMQNETLRQTQIAMEESRDRYVDLYDFAPVGYLTLDEAGLISEVNLSGALMLGVDRKSLQQRRFAQFVVPEDKDRWHRHFSSSLHRGEKHYCELAFTRADGIALDARVDYMHVKDSNLGHSVRIALTDITERKRVEEELRISAFKYQLLFESSRDALMLLVPHSGMFIGANQATLKLFGSSSEEEFTKFGPWDVSPERQPDGRLSKEKGLEMIAVSMREGSHFFEWEHQRLDDQLFTADVLLTRMEVRGESFLLACVRDITERKKVEQELRRNEERLLFAMKTVQMGGWELDLIGHTTYHTLGHDRIFGYESPLPLWTYEMFIDHVIPEDRSKVDLLFKKVTATQTDWSIECRIRRTDGELRWIWAAGKYLHDENGTVRRMAGVVQDITERKMLENELEKSRQSLRELAENSEILREEERKRIAREVHDELGQVLTALRMDVALINLRFGEQNAALLEKTQGMTVLLDQAGRCVRDIVSNLRPTALEMGIVSGLRWLCHEFAARTGSSCVLNTIEEHIELDEARAVAVFRIVQELLTNAVRHADASSVKIAMIQRNNDLHVEVSDDGKGFDPVTTVKNKSFGLLGIRERVIALGGDVKIVSAPNRGTVVTIIVPEKISGDTK